MSHDIFPVLDAGQARAILEKLHADVARHHGRAVITANGSDARCVLISEDELIALERALEILSGTTDAAIMRTEVLRIARDLRDQRQFPITSIS
jgi:PHD/YefM family antitoxin component YafN of YafNO toxin-antitoxin module